MGSQLSNTFKLFYGILFTIAFVFVYTNIDTTHLYDFTKLLELLDYFLLILMVILGVIGNYIILIVNSITILIGNRSIVIPFTNIVLFNFHVITPNNNQISGSILNNILLSIFPRSQRIFNGNLFQILTDFIQIWAILIVFFYCRSLFYRVLDLL